MTSLLHLLHSGSAVVSGSALAAGSAVVAGSAMAASFLVASVWEGFVVVVCVAVLLRLLPGLTAAVRSAIWSVVLLLVVLLPGFSLMARGHGALAVGDAGVLHASETCSLALLGVWAALSLLRVSQLAGSAIRLRRVARRAVVVAPAEAVAAILRGSRRRVQLCLSAEVDRPSVAGFFRPRILLSPELYAELSEAELQQVVLHEVEHLRRCDDWSNLLQKASLALVPLHPVLPWVDRQMCLERELACDDYVLGQTPRKAYASCLARVAEASMVRRGFSLALGVLGSKFGSRVRRWERTSELASRVHRILRAPEKRMSRGRTWGATAAVLGLVFAGAAGLARSPELVSFAPPAELSSGAQALAMAQQADVVQRVDAAPGISTARTEDASFHSARGPQPFEARELQLKAVMPEQEASAMRSSMVRSPMMRKSTRHMGRMASDRMEIGAREMVRRGVAMRETHVALVSWQVSTMDAAPMMMPAISISDDPQFVYAAVPVRDGWLIFQL